jgi:hypothetical protein
MRAQGRAYSHRERNGIVGQRCRLLTELASSILRLSATTQRGSDADRRRLTGERALPEVSLTHCQNRPEHSRGDLLPLQEVLPRMGRAADNLCDGHSA